MRLPPLLHRRHLLLASTAAIALAACGKRPPQAQAWLFTILEVWMLAILR